MSPEQQRAWLRGAAEAEADLRRARLSVRTFGEAPPWRDGAAALLWSEHRIALVMVAGTALTADLVEEVAGYNAVSLGAIRERFGRDVVEEAFHRAEDELRAPPEAESAAACREFTQPLPCPHCGSASTRYRQGPAHALLCPSCGGGFAVGGAV
jgi:hypothetical protein